MSETGNFRNIKETFFIILEFLLLVLKVLYYICEGIYKLFVPKDKKSVINEVVLITGAGGGIGRELAIGYASLGATIICWDINNETNEQTMNVIKEMGKSAVYAYRCDVSNKNEVFEMAEKVKKKVGNVTILINNAAIAPVQTFLNYNTEEISRTINTNLMAHYWTIKAFLPDMIERDHGHIVAISSVLGFQGGPYGTLYCTAKSAVRALMESIREELRFLYKKSSVKLTTIFPGLVTTDLSKMLKIRFPSLFGPYSPQQAASLIIDAQRRDCKEKSFPYYLLSLAPFKHILPDKALSCVVDFLDISVNEEFLESM